MEFVENSLNRIDTYDCWSSVTMNGTSETTHQNGLPASSAHGARRALKTPAALVPWLRAQSTNVSRHMEALRSFRREEFGSGAAAPTEGHIDAANELIASLRGGLLKQTKQV